MPKTPGKIHMYDMVKIDTIVFEIVGGGAFKAPPPPPDRIGLSQIYYIIIRLTHTYVCVCVDVNSWVGSPCVSHSITET